MSETRFWLIRHALVEENARAFLYGIMDVALCETTLERFRIKRTHSLRVGCRRRIRLG
jgi:broad specificity phosphatase PhoE